MDDRKLNFKQLFRFAIKIIGLSLIFRFVVFILFSVLLASIRNQMVDDNAVGIFNIIMFIFSLIALCIFAIILSEMHRKSFKTKNEFLKNYSAETNRSLPKKMLKEPLVIVICHILIQIPEMIFYSNFGYGYDNSIFIEKFYSLDVGFYLLMNNALLGTLISSVVLFGILYVGRLLAVRSWLHDSHMYNG